jgi:hypothetical protein
MFDAFHSPVELRVPVVVSIREGWHRRPSDAGRDLLRDLDATGLTADEALSALFCLQSERAALEALEAQLLVRAAGATAVVRDVLVETTDAAPRRITMVDEVVEEIAAVLRRPVAAVHADLAVARHLHGPLSRTREALKKGRITWAHARAIAEQAARMDGDHTDAESFADNCLALEERVLGRAAHETPSETRQRARRAVARIDAGGDRLRRRRARCTRDVRAWAEEDGLGVVMARLDAADAAWVIASVGAHARAHANDGTLALSPDATWGEVRAAAFLDLIRGPRHANGTREDEGRPRVSVEVQVLIDGATLAGITPEGPAWVQVGSGAPVAVDRDSLLALLADPRTPATLRRLVCDPLTGALIDRGADRYVASRDLVAWLVARDQTCRHPGCTRRARHCDVDHATDFAKGGRTTVPNTGMLCRRHHNGKTHGGWRIEGSRPDGSCTFVSPRGTRFEYLPVDLMPGCDPPAF